jgi:hypothetical protein
VASKNSWGVFGNVPAPVKINRRRPISIFIILLKNRHRCQPILNLHLPPGAKLITFGHPSLALMSRRAVMPFGLWKTLLGLRLGIILNRMFHHRNQDRLVSSLKLTSGLPRTSPKNAQDAWTSVKPTSLYRVGPRYHCLAWQCV